MKRARAWRAMMAFGAILSAAPVAAAAEDGLVEKVVPVGQAGTLKLRVPAAWKERRGGVRGIALVTLRAREPAGPFSMKLAPFPVKAGRKHILELDGLKRLALDVARKYVGSSVEKEVRLVPMQGATLRGFYATLTDASPNTGTYACITQVIGAAGDVLVNATLLHQKESPAQQAALQALTALTFEAGPGAAAAGPSGNAAGPTGGGPVSPVCRVAPQGEAQDPTALLVTPSLLALSVPDTGDWLIDCSEPNALFGAISKKLQLVITAYSVPPPRELDPKAYLAHVMEMAAKKGPVSDLNYHEGPAGWVIDFEQRVRYRDESFVTTGLIFARRRADGVLVRVHASFIKQAKKAVGEMLPKLRVLFGKAALPQ